MSQQNSPVVITGNTLPEDFCHTTWQSTFNAFVQALRGYLPGNFSTFNYGDDTPAPEDQDKPWIRTIAGVPDKIYIYYNGQWVSPHPIPESGSLVLWWEGTTAQLKTYDGGVDEAITATTGPFWEVITGWEGRMPIAPGTLPSTKVLAVGDTGGEEMHELTVEELAPHDHPRNPDKYNESIHLPANPGTDAVQGGNPTGRTYSKTGLGGGNADGTTEPHNNLPLYKALYPIHRSARKFHHL